MLDRIKMVKRKMDESLEQLCEVSWMFSRQPEKDFTRNRKLSFPKLVSFLLAMEGGTLTTELIERFGCSPDTASASAFVQQRSKLAPETFPSLFDLFVRKTQPLKLYKGFRLFAADGSDIQTPNNPGHISSFTQTRRRNTGRQMFVPEANQIIVILNLTQEWCIL